MPKISDKVAQRRSGRFPETWEQATANSPRKIERGDAPHITGYIICCEGKETVIELRNKERVLIHDDDVSSVNFGTGETGITVTYIKAAEDK